MKIIKILAVCICTFFISNAYALPGKIKPGHAIPVKATAATKNLKAQVIVNGSVSILNEDLSYVRIKSYADGRRLFSDGTIGYNAPDGSHLDFYYPATFLTFQVRCATSGTIVYDVPSDYYYDGDQLYIPYGTCGSNLKKTKIVHKHH